MTKRDKYLRKKYGITEATFNIMLAKYHRRCWICKVMPTKYTLGVDHDHKTGQVRGLLCFVCNKRLVGRWRAMHAPLLKRAAEYLESKIDWRNNDNHKSKTSPPS